LEWLKQALAYPGVRLLELSPEIAAESTALPGDFHKDPADQIIVATARVHGCRLLIVDRKILDYPHVQTQESGNADVVLARVVSLLVHSYDFAASATSALIVRM